jgi:hypothetical protein
MHSDRDETGRPKRPGDGIIHSRVPRAACGRASNDRTNRGDHTVSVLVEKEHW